MKSIKGIWVVGEKNIFGELAKIFDIATEASTILSIMFKTGYKEKELTKAMHAIQVLEKKSDEIAFKISEDITSGAISPNIIDNLLDSVQTADDIIDTYYYISRELNRMAESAQMVFENIMLNGIPRIKNCLRLRRNPS